jgi:YD repeat-containing protein
MEPITPAEGDTKLSFTYDGLGRRVSKTVLAWNQTTGKPTTAGT